MGTGDRTSLGETLGALLAANHDLQTQLAERKQDLKDIMADFTEAVERLFSAEEALEVFKRELSETRTQLAEAERLLREARDIVAHAADDGRRGPRANAARSLRDRIDAFRPADSADDAIGLESPVDGLKALGVKLDEQTERRMRARYESEVSADVCPVCDSQAYSNGRCQLCGRVAVTVSAGEK